MTDDHPRHHVVLQDGSSAYWHNDCHSRASGCEPCTAVVNSAGGVQGDELRSHIVANDPVGQWQRANGQQPRSIVASEQGATNG